MVQPDLRERGTDDGTGPRPAACPRDPGRAVLAAARAVDEPAGDGSRLVGALDRLTLDQRTILTLHHLDGRSLDELAAILEIPIGTVKSRLFTARRALAANLAETDR